MIRELPEHRALLADPESRESVQPPYVENLHRSIKPEIFVAVGLCPHLGCIPTYSPDGNRTVNLPHAGFYCPCHGSRFDAAGSASQRPGAGKSCDSQACLPVRG